MKKPENYCCTGERMEYQDQWRHGNNWEIEADMSDVENGEEFLAGKIS